MTITRRTVLAGAVGAAGLAAARAARAVSETDIFPVVETAHGKIRGLAAGGVKMFKGIHYGGNTTGRDRFLPPTPALAWTGTRDAFEYGQIAPQLPNSRENAYTGLISFDIQPGGMGEDCLVLNIWTPGVNDNAKRPVLVHRLDRDTSGCLLVATILIRSNAVGMMDIAQALGWVRDNIAGFGGDPSRVLVFGQSGGGAKTSVLMAMPYAKGLFHRAGVMSGATLRLATAETSAATAEQLMAVLNIDKTDYGKLQDVSMEELLAAQATMEAAARARGEAPRTFTPSVDGVIIPGHPFDPAAPATSADVPMIISNVIDERAYRMTNYDLDEAGLRAFIARRVGDARADELVKMYRGDDPKATPFVLQARFETDEVFRKPALIETELKSVLAQRGGAPVWSYLWRAPTLAYGGRYGTPHGADVGPSLHDVRGGLNDTGPDSLRLADELASCWVAFAASGDPNNKHIPHWPSYDVPDRATLVFDRETSVENDPRGAFREFWAKEPPREG